MNTSGLSEKSKQLILKDLEKNLEEMHERIREHTDRTKVAKEIYDDQADMLREALSRHNKLLVAIQELKDIPYNESED